MFALYFYCVSITGIVLLQFFSVINFFIRNFPLDKFRSNNISFITFIFYKIWFQICSCMFEVQIKMLSYKYIHSDWRLQWIILYIKKTSTTSVLCIWSKLYKNTTHNFSSADADWREVYKEYFVEVSQVSYSVGVNSSDRCGVNARVTRWISNIFEVSPRDPPAALQNIYFFTLLHNIISIYSLMIACDRSYPSSMIISLTS